MESASFIGVYSSKEIDCFSELRATGFSGVWYAWRKADGTCMALPVAHNNTPHGTCYILDTRDFESLFQPYVSATTPGDFVLRPPVRSDAPDLLDMWYEQSPGNPSSAQTSRAFRQGKNPHRFSGNDPSVASIADDEAMFTPVWHPDEMFLEPENKTAPNAAHIPEPPAAEAPASVHAPVQEGWRSKAGGFAPPPVVQACDEKEGSEDPETRSFRLEQHMRGKFDMLLQQMDATAGSEAEEEISRLLTLGATFGWKQKYMFTEFGLALRRKQRYKLALSSHLRALGLAPNDEHILFNVARAEYELGNLDNARQYLEKALSVAPDFVIAKNFQSFLLGRT